MSASSLKSYRVVVFEWLSHTATIKAASARDAEEEARRLWTENAEHEVFSFEDSGIDSVFLEEVQP
jgi:hypothetical protein